MQAARKHNHLVLFNGYDPEVKRRIHHPVYALLKEAAKNPRKDRRPLMPEEEMLVRPKTPNIVSMPVTVNGSTQFIDSQINNQSNVKIPVSIDVNKNKIS